VNLFINKFYVVAILLVSLAISSCFSSEDVFSSKKLASAMTYCSEVDISKKADLTNDELFFSLLEGPLYWENVKSILNDIEKSVLISSYNPDYKNYLATSNNPDGFYSYYLGDGNSFPLCLNIKYHPILSEVTEILKGYDLSDQDKVNDKEFIYTVSNTEGDLFFKFIFSDGVLSSIIYRLTRLD
jgi:hypothetical protein